VVTGYVRGDCDLLLLYEEKAILYTQAMCSSTCSRIPSFTATFMC
jgi:hypothetical protein